MNHRWSASRWSTFKGCRTKYYLQYIRELVVLGRDAALAEKGLAFHHIAELMNSNISIEELTQKAVDHLEGQTFDQEKYPVLKAIPRFYMWWHEYITPLEKQGFTVLKENWEHSAINKKAVVGAIDLLLTNEATKEAIIVDFKTGSRASISGYEQQLMLYAYLIKNKLKTTYDKIKLFVFFPLADIKIEDIEDVESTKKYMNKSYKELIYTEDQIKKMLNEYKYIIEQSEETDWDKIDLEENATRSFSCTWCGFLGSRFCPVSQKEGYHFPRKAKIIEKGDKEERDLKFSE